MDRTPSVTVLELHNGALVVRGFPRDVRPPFGLAPDGEVLTGHARLRSVVRTALAHAGRVLDDRVGPPPLERCEVPPAPAPAPAPFDVWCSHGHRGLVAGLREAHRVDFLLAAIGERLSRALLVVPDSGAEAGWRRVLRAHGLAAADVVTTAEAARTMHWRARRHDLLVVDRPEHQPCTILGDVLDRSPALARIGFVDRAGREVVLWSAGLGALLGIEAPATAPRHVELRLPLTGTERADHDAAWHTFLRGFDAFAALQPNAGFATFVQRARAEPAWRDSLLAWHRALRVAGWNAAKAAACASLLDRHRGEAVVVFTPDRRAAYELARAHLIAPITAELPRRERDEALAAFARRHLRALVGPRLLDFGVPEGSADVGILVGGGFGIAQHAARRRRVSPAGVVYELVALDTVEVGRAHRFGRSVAAATPAADGGRQ